MIADSVTDFRYRPALQEGIRSGNGRFMPVSVRLCTFFGPVANNTGPNGVTYQASMDAYRITPLFGVLCVSLEYRYTQDLDTLTRILQMNKKTSVIGGIVLVLLIGIVVIISLPENPAKDLPRAQDSNEPATPPLQEPTETAISYSFSKESTIGFTGSKVTGSHDGGFKSFEGSFMLDGGQLVGENNQIVIQMDSLWSDNDRLTGHLKSADFFEVETYPEASFKVTHVTKGPDKSAYTLTGKFTLHGVTKTITFPATITQEREDFQLKSEFVINRMDYGIVYPGKANDLIRDEVVIRLDMLATPSGLTSSD
jgi:polyisoprenoid-binding protein YceI